MLALHGILLFLKNESEIGNSENKCVCFLLKLYEMTHTLQLAFETNWFLIKKRIDECVNSFVINIT